MMISEGQKSLPAIGFLTVVRAPEQGLFGGYLVLNALGRPLEFHCTAPVRPNRAQQILYGPTLEPYLFGERIGKTLIDACKHAPTLIVTDVEPVLAARDFVAQPLMLVLPLEEVAADREPSATTSKYWRRDDAHADHRPRSTRLDRFQLDGYHLAVAAHHSEDQHSISDHWSAFAGQLDLEEPFGRIREAIDEARGEMR